MVTVPTQAQEFQRLPLRLAYTFLKENGLANEAAEIKASQDRVGNWVSSLRSAKILVLLRRENLLDKFIEMHWRFAKSPAGIKKLKWYDELYSKFKTSGTSSPPPEEETEVGTQFALEAHLRDYLAENLGILESGLSQWSVEDGDAVEFQVDDQGPSHRIDILAKDHGGLPVIIELKVSKGYEKTVGQVLYYRAKIKQRFSAERVRIFIVAEEISPELRAAASEVSDVFLFEYNLEVKVTAVNIGAASNT